MIRSDRRFEGVCNAREDFSLWIMQSASRSQSLTWIKQTGRLTVEDDDVDGLDQHDRDAAALIAAKRAAIIESGGIVSLLCMQRDRPTGWISIGNKPLDSDRRRMIRNGCSEVWEKKRVRVSLHLRFKPL